MFPSNRPRNGPPWRGRLYEVLFEADTDRAAKVFDIVLILAILASVAVVMLDSVERIVERHGELLRALEWAFTVGFTIEYAARLACVRSKRRYAFSFFGIVDLLAIVPTYLSVLFPGTRFLSVVRVLRVLRVFRDLKAVRYQGEARTLARALAASRYRIAVFLVTVLTLVVILGSLMYLVEGPSAGFTSIPVAVYWAVVTLTTVGFGDITPHTAPGQFVAAAIMLLGYGMIAVPTGIVSVGLVQAARDSGADDDSQGAIWVRVCSGCRSEGHDHDARFCKTCGGTVVDTGHE